MRKVAEISYDGFVNRDEKTGRFGVLVPGLNPAQTISERLAAYDDKDVRVTIVIEERSEKEVWG